MGRSSFAVDVEPGRHDGDFPQLFLESLGEAVTGPEPRISADHGQPSGVVVVVSGPFFIPSANVVPQSVAQVERLCGDIIVRIGISN